MKNLNLIFKILSITLLLNACAPSSDSDTEKPINSVNITELKSTLPSSLFTKKIVYFKDEKGNEVKVNISYSEEKDNVKNNDGHEYSRERGTIIYENKERKILIAVSLSSQLSLLDSTKPQYSLYVTNNVNDHADDLQSQVILFYDNNLKKLIKSPFAQEIETDVVLGKTFKNVFRSNYVNDPYKNGLGFNTTYGIISLNDYDNNSYVFDRFE